MVSVLRYQQLTEIHVCPTDHIACGVQHQHGTRSLMHRVRSGRANTQSALLRIFAACAAKSSALPAVRPPAKATRTSVAKLEVRMMARC